MKKTAFVCFGNKERDNAFVYNESPRNENGEEFFVFILPGDPAWSGRLREFFRIAISTSRMGSAKSYFIRFLSNIKERLKEEADLKNIFSDSMILLLIKRGNEIYFLHNRETNIVHWDGSVQKEDINRLMLTVELSSGHGNEQPDLFDKSLEELFLLRRISSLSGRHSLIFTPSAEFADRYRELFLNSVFFPSFEVPDADGVNVETDMHLPAIHWNVEKKDDTTGENGLDMRKFRKLSIPLASGIIAAALAAFIFFWPFADNQDKKNDKGNILLSAGDASRKTGSEKFSADKQKPGKNIYSEESFEAEKRAERIPEQNEILKTQNITLQEVVKNAGSKIKLKRSWRKKFAKPVTSSPVLCAQNIIFGCRDGFLYSFSDKGDFKWKYNLGEGVGSSPLCFKEEKVIGCDYQGDIVCLDPENGEILWENSIESKIISSLAIIKKSLLVGTMAGDLYSISLDDGGIGWKKHLGSGIWSSIVTVKDYIVVATVDGNLIKLDSKGKILWQIEPGGEIYSTPVCLEKENCVVVGTNNKLISAFSLSDGSLLWQYTVSSKVRGTPATDGKRIVIGTDDGKVYSFNMSGRILWMQVIGKAVRSKPLIYGKVIFITGYNTKLTAIDIDSGNIIDTFNVESPIYSSPLYFNDRIFFGSNDGHFHSIDIVQKD